MRYSGLFVTLMAQIVRIQGAQYDCQEWPNGFVPEANLTEISCPNLSTNAKELPLGLFNLTGLTRIDLEGLGLTGMVPPDLSEMTVLTHLNLGDNSLEGQIPTAFPESLEKLHLFGNNFVGHVPDLTYLSNLQELRLEENELEGPLPNLTNMTNLLYVVLHDNEFGGSIPDDYASLTNLNTLDISKNDLEGCMSAEFSNLCDSFSDWGGGSGDVVCYFNDQACEDNFPICGVDNYTCTRSPTVSPTTSPTTSEPTTAPSMAPTGSPSVPAPTDLVLSDADSTKSKAGMLAVVVACLLQLFM